MKMKVKTINYDTRCGRCGQLISAGKEVVYIPFRDTNPLLQGNKNPRVFHIDPLCAKKENYSNDK